MDSQYWVFTGVQAGLLTVCGFLARQWVTDVNRKQRDTDKKMTEMMVIHSREISELKEENGKRKGDSELLKKDIGNLSDKTTSSFENLKYQMEYQKESIDEIKVILKENSKEENNALIQLLKQFQNKTS